jgi:uncharacterized protein YndB with AHSA1/START domain
MPANVVSDAPSLRIERHYAASPEQVWRAWTDPQALAAWFGPGEMNSVTLAQTDVRVGGRFRVAFRMPDGETHDVSGVYREVQVPRRLVFTWAWKSTPERESLVTVALEPQQGGTLMRFLHEQFFDIAARDSHEGGWRPTFDKLARHLSQA